MVVLAVKVYLEYLKVVTTVNGVHDPARYSVEVATFLDQALTQSGLDDVLMFAQPASSHKYQEAISKYWATVTTQHQLLNNHPHKIRPMISGTWLKMVFRMWEDVEFALMEVSREELLWSSDTGGVP